MHTYILRVLACALGLGLTYAYIRCPNDNADYTFWLVHLVYSLHTCTYVAPMAMQHAFAGIEATGELGGFSTPLQERHVESINRLDMIKSSVGDLFLRILVSLRNK